MIKDSEFDTVISQGEHAAGQAGSFSCLRCGVCCSKYQPLLSRAEERQIADGLALSEDEFLDKYTDHRWGGTESFLLRHQDGACIFLSRDAESRMTTCRINAFKPMDCRTYAADLRKPECRQGLENQGASL